MKIQHDREAFCTDLTRFDFDVTDKWDIKPRAHDTTDDVAVS